MVLDDADILAHAPFLLERAKVARATVASIPVLPVTLAYLGMSVVAPAALKDAVEVLLGQLMHAPPPPTPHTHSPHCEHSVSVELTELIGALRAVQPRRIALRGSARVRIGVLVEALRHVPHLKHLMLGSNSLDDVEIRVFAENLHLLAHLVALDLSNNQIGSAGAQALVAHLGSVPQLTTLNLSGCSIGDARAQALAAHLGSMPYFILRTN